MAFKKLKKIIFSILEFLQKPFDDIVMKLGYVDTKVVHILRKKVDF